jgi:hypothetical protein
MPARKKQTAEERRAVPRLRVARHEAAHAVCAVKMGLYVHSCGLGAHRMMRGSAGWTKLREQRCPDPLDWAHVFLAGDAAERHFYRQSRRAFSGDDWSKARALGFRDRSLDSIALSADVFVAEHAAAIDRVAYALAGEGQLSRPALLKAIRAASRGKKGE